MFEQALISFSPILAIHMLKPYRPKQLNNELVEIQKF